MNRDSRDKEADMSASPIEVVGKWLENLLAVVERQAQLAWLVGRAR
jgi:hypothetical protein